MTVIPFRRPKSSRRFTQPVRPPGALADLPRPPLSAKDADDERLRMRQNLGALVVVVLLLVTGMWMIERLREYSHTLFCIESGHRACMKIDTSLPR